jgi:UDP-N-acetylglucosamine transferase subunit ALG13
MVIELSDDQALVLFELLSRYGENGNDRQLAVREAAERNVLWAISGILEKQLVAPLQKEYVDLLSAARARVEEQGGSW